MMPKLDGFEVCRRLRADPTFPFTPIIMVTAMADSKDVVAGLEAGGDEYLTKPVDHAALAARVNSMLRIKRLHDTVETLAAEVKEWNASLERRVAEQVGELERVGRLRRFFSPSLAELIVNGGADDPLKSHRREITVVFLDLRGFTAFAEVAEPEEVMGVLREYHHATGEIIVQHEGTLEHFTGDGMTILFNDPLPIPNPAERAVRMALAIRERIGTMAKDWVKRGYDLSLGIGVAQGFATIGAIGFEGRWDYSAIGTVTNLAARLCGEAPGDQILISQRVYAGNRHADRRRAAGIAGAEGLPPSGAGLSGARAEGACRLIFSCRARDCPVIAATGPAGRSMSCAPPAGRQMARGASSVIPPNHTTTRAPCPLGGVSIETRARRRSAISLTMASPRPDPSPLVPATR